MSATPNNAAPTSSVFAIPHFDRTSQNASAATKVVWQTAIPWMIAPAIVIAVVLGLVINWVIGPVLGLLIGISVGVVRTAMLRTASTVGLRQIVGGRPIDSADGDGRDDSRHQARFVNLVEGLCVSTGTREPTMLIVDEPHLNIAVYGPAADATLVATSGLLSDLSRVELEGVVAAALWRIRTGDAELAGLVSTFRAGSTMKQHIDTPAPTGGQSARLSAPFDEYRHVLCDLGAVSITRYPPGLLTALERMSEAGTAVATATWGTAGLWMCDPSPSSSSPVHAPVALRIGVLAEL